MWWTAVSHLVQMHVFENLGRGGGPAVYRQPNMNLTNQNHSLVKSKLGHYFIRLTIYKKHPILAFSYRKWYIEESQNCALYRYSERWFFRVGQAHPHTKFGRVFGIWPVCHMWPALAKQGTSGTILEQQAADSTFGANQHCRVFMISDNHRDQYFQFVKDSAIVRTT